MSSVAYINLLVALLQVCGQCLVFLQVLLFMYMHVRHNATADQTQHRVNWIQTALEQGQMPLKTKKKQLEDTEEDF